jgi:serine/threonine protein kinase
MGLSDDTRPLDDPGPSHPVFARQLGMPREGDRIGDKYLIEKIQGVGGMGTVFSAYHEILDQRVAVKVLSSVFAENDEFLGRFLTEARAAAKLRSEHVARVMDAGKLASGLPFIVMELLDGCDLDEMLRCHGPLDPTEVADFMIQALEALAQAHAAGIVHRDLKPSNLFLAVKPDGTSILKILDFGISKASSAVSKKSTADGRMLGSPSYMSPEQVRSSRTVDPRTDIWALGVVMHELLTGQAPFEREGVGATLVAILEDSPPSLADLNPRVSRAYADVVLRCLRRDRNERYADVAELATALAPFASDTWRRLVRGIRQTLTRAGSPVQLPTPPALFPRSLAANQETVDAPSLEHPRPGADGTVELSSALLMSVIPPFRKRRRSGFALGVGAVALGIAGLAWAVRSPPADAHSPALPVIASNVTSVPPVSSSAPAAERPPSSPQAPATGAATPLSKPRNLAANASLSRVPAPTKARPTVLDSPE